VRPLFTGIARVEKLAWAKGESGRPFQASLPVVIPGILPSHDTYTSLQAKKWRPWGRRKHNMIGWDGFLDSQY
jgi:hypothetical protein